MRAELETKLRAELLGGACPRDVIASMVAAGDIASPKQAWRTLEKWGRRGEYEWGVCLDLGWMTERKR